MASTTVPLDLAAQHRRGRIYVALAAVAWSTAGLLQRELTVDIPTQLAGRGFFAVLGILGFVAVAERGGVVRGFRAIGLAGLAVAVLMAISSGTFLIALNHATVANVLFMQALAPVLAAVLGILVGERVERKTWIAMAVAIAGVAVMTGGPGGPSGSGRAAPFLSAVPFAAPLLRPRPRP